MLGLIEVTEQFTLVRWIYPLVDLIMRCREDDTEIKTYTHMNVHLNWASGKGLPVALQCRIGAGLFGSASSNSWLSLSRSPFVGSPPLLLEIPASEMLAPLGGSDLFVRV